MAPTDEYVAAHQVVVIVLSWNHAEHTIKCLSSLQESPGPVPVIVVDNGSNDNSVSIISSRYPAVTVLALPANLGFARGVNLGIQFALEHLDYARVFVILNNDAEVRPATLLQGARLIDSDPSIGLLTGKIVHSDGRIWYGGGRIRRWRGSTKISGAGEPDRGQVDRARDVTAVSLAFAFVRRDVFTSVGILAENYFFGQEEWDYSLRVARAGLRLRYEPSLECIHGGDGSHDNNAPEYVYLGYRHKMIFQQTYLTGLGFQVWRILFRLYAYTILPWASRVVHGMTLDSRSLRLCAVQALRDHVQGGRTEESDLVKFRELFSRESPCVRKGMTS